MTTLIETARLKLRYAKQEDFDLIYNQILADQEVTKYLFSGIPLNQQEALDLFRDKFIFGPGEHIGFLVLTEKTDDQAIGFAGLIPCRHPAIEGYEFGYALGKPSWGKGFATEIAQGQVDWALDELKLSSVYALVGEQNLASIKVLNKLRLTEMAPVFLGDKDQQDSKRLVFKAERCKDQ